MARRALTAPSVNRIKPPAKGQVEHFDKGFPGLALRVSYGGGKSWVFFYRHGSRLRRMTLGTYPALSLAEARDAWRAARTEVQRGRDPSIAKKHERPSTSFAAVAEDWLKRDQAKNRTFAQVRRMMDNEVLPVLGHLAINEIGRRDILDLIDGIADRGAVVMARRIHARLHRLFRWAIGRGVIEIDPMANLPKPGSETTRDRVLIKSSEKAPNPYEELIAVWGGAEELGYPYGSAVQLLILTGARREEIGKLRWSEIDGDTIELRGERTKNGEPHSIPLSTPAKTLIAELPRFAECPFLFTPNGRSPLTGWSSAKARLDEIVSIAPWRTHDLRRTVATGLQKLGTQLTVTEAVLGHTAGSRGGIVKVYQTHSYANEKRAALEAWGAYVMALVEGRQPGQVLPMRR